MKKKLKINKHFTPCPIDDEDEMYPNGIFVFNITKMAEYLRHNNITCEEVLVNEFSRGFSKFKEKAARYLKWVTRNQVFRRSDKSWL